MWKCLAVIGLVGLAAGYGLGWMIHRASMEIVAKKAWMEEIPVEREIPVADMDEYFSRDILQKLNLYESKNYMLTKCVENAVMTYSGMELMRGLLLERIDNLLGKLNQYSLRVGNEDTDFTEIVNQVKAIREIGSSDELWKVNLEMMEAFRSALRVNESTRGSGHDFR